MSTSTETLREKIDELEAKPKAGIMEQAICVRLSLHKPGTRRKLKSNASVAKKEENLVGEQVDTDIEIPIFNVALDTDRNMLHLSKEIMDAPEVKAVHQKDREIKAYMGTKALPSIFQNGVWLIPIPLVGEVDHVLRTMERTRKQLVEVLIEKWDAIKANAQERLKDMFNEKDYDRWPTAEHIRSAFSMDWEYISYGVNEKLKQISKALYEREQQKIEQKCNDAAEQITYVLREATAEVVGELVDKLTSRSDGKPKKIKDEKLDAAKSFLNDFAARNITGDTELEALVDQAKSLIEGVNADSINDVSFRDRVRAGFEEVKKSLDTMIENKPARRFRGIESGEGA